MSLVARFPDGNEVYLKILPTTPFRKVYEALSLRGGGKLPLGSYALTYKGNIQDLDIPCGIVEDGGIVDIKFFD